MSFHFPSIAGIVNVTPDSFSDGGQFGNSGLAVAHALQLVQQGADLLDIGGESTRPGAAEVSVQEELDRVIPVIEGIRQQNADIPISIDTRKSQVAEQALTAGATIINDVSAGMADVNMFSVAAKHECPIILMHMQGTPATMQNEPVYDNVVATVFDFLHDRINEARAAGVENIIADVGIGFGKTLEHNLELLRSHSVFQHLGVPLMLGISRKRFLGAICGIDNPAERDTATALCHALLLNSGAAFVRVHNVSMIVQLKALSQRLFAS
jgi:dihydropteroate synthase